MTQRTRWHGPKLNVGGGQNITTLVPEYIYMSHKTARVGDTLLVMVAVYFRYIVFLQVTVSIDFKR